MGYTEFKLPGKHTSGVAQWARKIYMGNLRLTLVGRARGVNGVLGKAAEREGGIPRNQTYISGVD